VRDGLSDPEYLRVHSIEQVHIFSQTSSVKTRRGDTRSDLLPSSYDFPSFTHRSSIGVSLKLHSDLGELVVRCSGRPVIPSRIKSCNKCLSFCHHLLPHQHIPTIKI
ncbi:hypothetical protein PENTCL1PPCAC_28087, partial [Pristionchus entomophagus]